MTSFIDVTVTATGTGHSARFVRNPLRASVCQLNIFQFDCLETSRTDCPRTRFSANLWWSRIMQKSTGRCIESEMRSSKSMIILFANDQIPYFIEITLCQGFVCASSPKLSLFNAHPALGSLSVSKIGNSGSSQSCSRSLQLVECVRTSHVTREFCFIDTECNISKTCDLLRHSVLGLINA